ncbi:hypothetical protein ACFQFQ_07175 [Sulfitobacter porphyrae]|uniref:Uncharacterized protein n=1 Tax=Sulfitobacter porphyrae TaxID=1246864 RepID=A0ABW2B0W4_9RHOB
MTGQGGASVLDILCPMHLVINATGHITHAGPTARKLAGDRPMVGARFLEVFAVNRPRAVASMADLRLSGGTKLHLETRAAPRTSLKAVLVPLPEGRAR